MESDGIGRQILIILALIIANGLFSMTELAIVSSRKSRLESMSENGSKGAETALNLVENPNQMFSTVQIGITFIGLLTGMYGGTEVAQPVIQELKGISWIEPYAETAGMALIMAVITYLSLILGELVPKQLAINNPEKISSVVARPMKFFSTICLPIVKFLSLSTELTLSFLGVKKSEETPVTEDEIKMLLEQGAELGAFEKEEPELVDRVFRLADFTANDAMTNRTQVEWLDMSEDSADLMEMILHFNHYRLPVGNESLDEMLGIVDVNEVLADLFKELKHNKAADIKSSIDRCVKDPVYIPESMTLMKILSLFRTEGVHEAIVLDEYGAFSGIITLHDILEELVGNMPTGDTYIEKEETKIIQRDIDSWLINGLLPIEDFKIYFNIEEELPGEEEDLYRTVAGFITFCFGRIPEEAEVYDWNNYRFEVVDIDNVRIDKIMVTRLSEMENMSD